MQIRWMYAFIDRPAAAYQVACDFWTQATGTRRSAFRGEHDEFATLLAPEGDAHVKVQALQGAADVGGIHVDLSVDDVEAATEVTLGLGSSLVYQVPGLSVLRSPGGFQYCLVGWDGESERVRVFEDPGGSRSRLDQVCLDVPPNALDRELEFWHALTGWAPVQSGMPEFHVIKPPPTMPFRILVQRLDEAGGDPEVVTGHIDLACGDDVDAVAAFHKSLGATLVSRHRYWAVMRDPAGSVYCLTARDPETGTLH
ncbi:MAG TPA: VOC family protein [Actinocrinis sp.]|nr:VOC family protein [Actinocrinis sp.]